MKRRRSKQGVAHTAEVKTARDRIIAAALAAFTERGFAAASTLEIATRAGVSKRELYSLFGSKQQMLVTCIAERARRLRLPADWQAPRNTRELQAGLVKFGSRLLWELSDPHVVSLYRLAVAEVDRSPEVAQALARHGHQASLATLGELLAGARAAGVMIEGDTEALAGRYMSLLLDDLLMSLALGLRGRPGRPEILERASEAARAVLRCCDSGSYPATPPEPEG